VAAVVLRVDSPGGDALASDLMWREIRKLGEFEFKEQAALAF
jgi:protease-4